MENLLHLGLSNAVATVALALGAAAATFLIRRRPALIHGLWLLVLLKLFTPPLVRLPVPWTTTAAPAPAEVSATWRTVNDPAEGDETPPLALLRFPEGLLPAEGEADPLDLLGPPSDVVAAPPVGFEEPAPELVVASAAPAPPAAASPDWFVVAGVVWGAGSLAWFLLAAVRVQRFRRLLSFAVPAPPALRERAARLARRLGLARCPVVLLVPGRLSPMLWAAGGVPRLLVPAALLGQVRDDQLDTLLLHELAHLRRRDHWVRGLEFLAMGLYWWNPVVWWARRELREAEEQCCDAWVVSVLSGSRRAYAEALVETLDFLSQAPTAPPLLASGIGHVSDLKRRLTMIMSGTTPRALTWRGGLTVLGLTALLPLLPAWVRAEEPEGQRKTIEIRLNRVDVEEGPVADGKAQSDAQKLEAELKQKVAEIRDLERRLKEAQLRAEKKPEGPSKGTGGDVRIWRAEAVGADKGVIILRGEGQHPAPIGATPKGTLYELVPGEKGTLILRPVAPTAPLKVEGPIRFSIGGEARPGATPAVPAPPAPPEVRKWRMVEPGAQTDGRTRDVEKRLDAIMKELEQLRKEMKTPQPAPKPGSPYGPAKPQEQGKLDPFQKGIVLQTEDGKIVAKWQVETEDAVLKMRAIEQQKQEAETTVDELRRNLEKVRAWSQRILPS